jgi:hypothetical protein
MLKVKPQKGNRNPKINEAKGKGKGKEKGKGKDNAKGKRKDEEIDMDEELMDEDIDDMNDIEAGDFELFWNLTLSPNEQATLEPPPYFEGVVCITHACFGAQVNKGSRSVVYCTTATITEPIPICVLNEGGNENQALDLKFESSATFTVRGQQPSAVYLTGYLQREFMDDMPMDDDEDMLQRQASRLKYGYPGEEEVDDEDDIEDEMFSREPVTKKKKNGSLITKKSY